MFYTLDKQFIRNLQIHFIDVDLYGHDLDSSILVYLIRDSWTTLIGDQYIKTLYETFEINRGILLKLHHYKRLIDLVFKSLNHIVTFEGHLPLSQTLIKQENEAKYGISISVVDKPNPSNLNSSTKQTANSNTVKNDPFFLNVVNDIRNHTEYLSKQACNNCQSTHNIDNTSDHRLQSDVTLSEHCSSYCNLTCNSDQSPPIPCKDRNVPLLTNQCQFFQSNKSNNSSQMEDPVSVVNLSHRTLTPPELAILQRGLKFCPTPGEPDIAEQHNDLEKFHLRLKRFLHFYRTPDPDSTDDTIIVQSIMDPNSPFKHQKFKNPSFWIPPPVSNLENFITKNHLDLSDSKIPKIKFNNISKEERLAIRNLSKDTSIVIKQADKGGAVVIMSREDYIKEGNRQLSDAKFYVQTDSDLTQEHYNAIETKCNEMLKKEEIDISVYDYLTHTPVRTAQFYMLPKIHKKKASPPGRPIVSGNGCPTERISQFVDYFLQPGVKKITSYIQDTTDFLRMLQQLGILPKNTLLVTLDVSSLYTNIPNIEGIEACKTLLERERPASRHPTNNSLVELLTQVLTMNNFDFDEKHYLQVGGTAMGTRVAPCYANTFMGWFEDMFVYSYHTLPELWKRYIDDIFVIWTHSDQELNEFIAYLNHCMPSIKFEAEISQETVNFLDVKVSLDPEGHIITDLYTKPTDSHNYLDYRSAHPKHCRSGIPYSQFLRLRRICSYTETFVQRCREMSKHFIRANYPPHIIKTAFNRVYETPREPLLALKPVVDDNQDSTKSFLITTFHPYFRECDNIVTRNWDLLDRSSSTRPLMNLQVIRGNRRSKNLRDLLVRARLPIMPAAAPQPTTPFQRTTTPPPGAPRRTITPRCTRRGCRYCRIINRTGTITSSVTGKQYNTRSNVTCHSNNIIYCLHCLTCNKQYVGQTKRKLVERLREHFRSVNQQSTNHIIGRHFNSNNHNGLDSMRVYVLSFIRANPHNPQSRLLRIKSELQWIHRLRSFVPKGLNLMDTTTYI